MNTIAITNRKGGVGKTTTAVNLACELAARGRRCALMDLDTQRHASIHVGVRIDPPLPSPAYRALVMGQALSEVCETTAYGFDLIAAGKDLDKAADELRGDEGGDALLALRQAVAEAAREGRWDLLFLDCPPNIGDVSQAALVAADYVLVPMPMQTLPYEGLVEVIDLIAEVKGKDNPSIQLGGVFATISDDNTQLYSVIRGKVEDLCSGSVLMTRVRRNIALAEAAERGMPVVHHRADCHGAADYRALAAELIERGVL